MFGKIIEIVDNVVRVERIKLEKEVNILNYHVIFDEGSRKIAGEVIVVLEHTIDILLLGEIRNGKFISGIIRKPNFNIIPRIIYKNEAELLLGKQEIKEKDTLLIGKSFIYDNFNVTVNLNEFLSNHFAIVGNTGSGKSCGVARIIQNIFDFNKIIPSDSHVVIFDAYGEYNTAFNYLNNNPLIGYKSYTTQTDFPDTEIIKVPLYFLETDDLALLLNVSEATQLLIIEKALYYVYIFTSKDEKVIDYKNSIIASSLLDILASGRNPVQIRDQLVAVLSQYNTPQLNLNSIIVQPGYNRTIKQCLNIDQQGKMNAVSFVVEFLETYTNSSPKEIKIEKNTSYNLDDLYYAFEFALISEGIFNNNTIYDKASILKVRLKALIDSPYSTYFDYPDFISKDDYINKIFKVDSKKAQLVNMNFNYIDERFAKVLTKVFAKLFFNYAVTLEHRASYPIHLILEEAHRYVQNEEDIQIIGYNIFDRITKEGRKYGVILGFITQRPCELSKTAISQCSNFIAFRMFYPEDIRVISSISANVSEENIAKLKNLTPGVAMAFGNAFATPLLIKMDLPNPMPQSSSVDLVNKWYQKEEKSLDTINEMVSPE